MQEMQEIARLLIKFREMAREEEDLACELGMEMLSCVRIPILRQAIDELTADSEKDGQEKYGQKLGMNNILTRTIKSMKGMYAEAMEDEKTAESLVVLANFNYYCYFLGTFQHCDKR